MKPSLRQTCWNLFSFLEFLFQTYRPGFSEISHIELSLMQKGQMG